MTVKHPRDMTNQEFQAAMVAKAWLTPAAPSAESALPPPPSEAAAELMLEASKHVQAADTKAAEAIKSAETKAAEATTKAQQRVTSADLRIAAKDAGAHDAGDVSALVDRSKIQFDANGDIKNAAELVAEMKRTKPHLFGTPSPTSGSGGTTVSTMTDQQFNEALRNRAWRNS